MMLRTSLGLSRSVVGMRTFANDAKASPAITNDAIERIATHTLSKWSGGPLTRAGAGGRSSVSGVCATVFGATGFYGRYVVNRLGRVGTQVVCPYRGEEYDYGHLKLMGDLGQLQFFEYNIRNYSKLKELVKHSNVVINLVGNENNTHNFTVEDTNVDAARLIARACREAGVDRLLHVSALNAHPNSESRLLRAKANGEIAVREEFPHATVFRPADTYGLEDRYLNRIANLSTLPFGAPMTHRQLKATKRPVYVNDVANAIVNAINNNASAGQTYELVGPKEFTNESLLQFINHVTKHPERHYIVPEQLYLTVAGLIEQWPLYKPLLPRDFLVRQSISDVTTESLPGFEDLGINPTDMEKVGIAILRVFRNPAFFEDAVSV